MSANLDLFIIENPSADVARSDIGKHVEAII